MCQQIAEHVTTKLQEVSNHTLDKIREMNPELANSLSPNIPSFTDLKWSDLFKMYLLLEIMTFLSINVVVV